MKKVNMLEYTLHTGSCEQWVYKIWGKNINEIHEKIIAILYLRKKQTEINSIDFIKDNIIFYKQPHQKGLPSNGEHYKITGYNGTILLFKDE